MIKLAEKFRPEVVDPSTIQQVLKQADGVPFVLEQMLLSFDPDHPERNTLLPQSVESLIHGRLNKLSNAGKALAQATSVFGEETDTQLAARVIGSRIEDLQGPIRELQELGLIYPVQDRLRFSSFDHCGSLCDAGPARSAAQLPQPCHRCHLVALCQSR